jgi:hypothetical protein
MKRYLFLFLNLFSLLSAAETNVIPYLTSECDSLALVDGLVNTYTGHLVQLDQDMVVGGVDPIILNRFYDGGHHFASDFGYGVGLPYPLSLKCIGKDLYVELRRGLQVLFELTKYPGKEERYHGKIPSSFFKAGYTNSCEQLLRGQPDLRAMTVEGKKGESFTVSLGDGTRRHYTKYSADNSYRLTFRLFQQVKNSEKLVAKEGLETVAKAEAKFDLDALSKAGEVLD